MPKKYTEADLDALLDKAYAGKKQEPPRGAPTPMATKIPVREPTQEDVLAPLVEAAATPTTIRIPPESPGIPPGLTEEKFAKLNLTEKPEQYGMGETAAMHALSAGSTGAYPQIEALTTAYNNLPASLKVAAPGLAIMDAISRMAQGAGPLEATKASFASGPGLEKAAEVAAEVMPKSQAELGASFEENPVAATAGQFVPAAITGGAGAAKGAVAPLATSMGTRAAMGGITGALSGASAASAADAPAEEIARQSLEGGARGAAFSAAPVAAPLVEFGASAASTPAQRKALLAQAVLGAGLSTAPRIAGHLARGTAKKAGGTVEQYMKGKMAPVEAKAAAAEDAAFREAANEVFKRQQAQAKADRMEQIRKQNAEVNKFKEDVKKLEADQKSPLFTLRGGPARLETAKTKLAIAKSNLEVLKKPVPPKHISDLSPEELAALKKEGEALLTKPGYREVEASRAPPPPAKQVLSEAQQAELARLSQLDYKPSSTLRKAATAIPSRLLRLLGAVTEKPTEEQKASAALRTQKKYEPTGTRLSAAGQAVPVTAKRLEDPEKLMKAISKARQKRTK